MFQKGAKRFANVAPRFGKSMASTIKDIAERLGISISTVSYALNDGPRPVPAETRRRVLEVAEELAYRPNRLARSLQKRRSHVIGIVPTISHPDRNSGPFFLDGVSGVMEAGAAMNYDVLLYTQHSADDEEAAAPLLADGRADGLIFLAPRLDAPALDYVRRIRFPHVVISGQASSGSVCIGVNNAEGIELAVAHLVELGHTQIGHLTGSLVMADGVSRRDGFLRAMERRGIPVAEEWVVRAGFARKEAHEAAEMILSGKERPTAVVCANDEVALALIEVARAMGLRIPHDLSVTGFDDSVFARATTPALTTISQPVHPIAVEAALTLVRMIEGSADEVSREISPFLVERGSTAPLYSPATGNTVPSSSPHWPLAAPVH